MSDDSLYMPIDQTYPGLRKVHEKPPIYFVDGFLTDAECEHLIAVATPLLQRSKTHATGGSEHTKGRTSLTCHLSKKTAPCPAIMQKLQRLTNKPFGHMELPQVIRRTADALPELSARSEPLLPSRRSRGTPTASATSSTMTASTRTPRRAAHSAQTAASAWALCSCT